ncbi:MAG: outer membrane beta-barrel protein [Deferribacteres bacterium]|nr:outer membrane beta-barrel protein [candidate division KSB1 bacterium]MCB9504485.1 outer membrane beta-barrel protein [Deferribacteres bacterium]
MKKLVLVLLALLLVTGGAFAQSDIGLKGAGLRLGLVDPDGIDSTIGFEGFADLGSFNKIALEASVLYWSKSVSVVSLRDLAIGATGRYFFDMADSPVKPFASAGLALHMMKSQVDYDFGFLGSGSESVTSTEFGIKIGGGANYELNEKMTLTGEVSYHLGDAEQFNILGGVSYKLGQ